MEVGVAVPLGSREVDDGAAPTLDRAATGAGRTIRRTARTGPDRTRTLSLTVLNRRLTLWGFSPQLALVDEARTTNAQARDYRRNRAELRFVQQF